MSTFEGGTGGLKFVTPGDAMLAAFVMAGAVTAAIKVPKNPRRLELIVDRSLYSTGWNAMQAVHAGCTGHRRKLIGNVDVTREVTDKNPVFMPL